MTVIKLCKGTVSSVQNNISTERIFSNKIEYHVFFLSLKYVGNIVINYFGSLIKLTIIIVIIEKKFLKRALSCTNP